MIKRVVENVQESSREPRLASKPCRARGIYIGRNEVATITLRPSVTVFSLRSSRRLSLMTIVLSFQITGRVSVCRDASEERVTIRIIFDISPTGDDVEFVRRYKEVVRQGRDLKGKCKQSHP